MTLSLDARANVLIAALLAISLAFIYWHTPVAAKTVVIRHEMAIVVKEKPQSAPGAQDNNKSAGPNSSELDDQNSQNDDQDEDDDASPDPDESYQT